MSATRKATRVAVKDIRTGDEFVHDGARIWIALDSAQDTPGGVTLKVQFVGDGGIGFREWENRLHTILVKRPI